LVDIPISNAINSGLREIFVLTQFNSASLNAHLHRTYRFDPFTNGFVEVLAAEQTERSGDWFQGTADAVRKHLDTLARPGVEHVLILAGDHLYRMRYDEMIAHHEATGADITVSAIAVPRSGCDGMGVLAADAAGRIRQFREKPSADEDISEMRIPESLRRETGIDGEYLASMGVYVFRADVLREILADETQIDFGGDILPAALERLHVAAFPFDDYWEDIGTIGAFYEANMALCSEEPPFRFYTPEAPIFTRARFLPPSVVRRCTIDQSILAEGTMLTGATVSHSVIGLRSVLNGCTVERSIVMGADFFEVGQREVAARARGEVPLGVGPGASIRRAIIDKNTRIGEGAVIHGHPDRPDERHEGWSVRDGIVIVAKNSVIPAGAVL